MATSEKSLYARIGGYDVLAAIVDEFLQTLTALPQMERYGTSMNLDTRKRNRQLTLDFLAAAAGGPTLYLGKDMKPAHAGLGISGSDWQLALDHIARALNKFKIPDREGKELLAIVDGLKGEIVER
ncbi:MAG TPA: group 1 truncated hemoglobin [Candidatus Binataceae bacterium]|nr:group 1 truncated hemoglobin [Candidatus Binataceae bacterium]